MESSMKAQTPQYDTEVMNRYECEVCGLVVESTEQDAYMAGWDYPPFIGLWGIISPRTCPNCGVEKTAYWFLMMRSAGDQSPVPDHHVKTIKRILSEVPSDATAR